MENTFHLEFKVITFSFQQCLAKFDSLLKLRGQQIKMQRFQIISNTIQVPCELHLVICSDYGRQTQRQEPVIHARRGAEYYLILQHQSLFWPREFGVTRPREDVWHLLVTSLTASTSD